MIDVHSTYGFAAERYLLGELSTDERDRFEDHYFSCTECADRVLAAAIFLDNARAVLPEMDRGPVAVRTLKKERARSFGWFPWSFAPQAAMACIVLLAAVAGYQNAFQIPRLRAAAAGPELVISSGQVVTARRAASNLVFAAKDPAAVIVVANEWEETFPRYAFEVRKGSEPEPVLSSSAPGGPGPAVISIHTARLGSGNYTMILYGVSRAGSRQIVAQHPFTIQE